VAGAALVADAATLQIAQGSSAGLNGAVDVAVGFTSADADDQGRLPLVLESRLSLNTHIVSPAFPFVKALPAPTEVTNVTNGISLAVDTPVKRLILLLLSSLFIAAPATASLRLEVDIKERKLVALVDGKQVERYDVAVGKKAYPTPKGSFKINKVIWNPSWKPPDSKWARGKTAKPAGHPDNPMKKVKIFFKEPDYYIHGTAEDHSLGKAASHGCVRMSESDVTELGKLVMKHGGKPKPAPWYRRILQSQKSQVVYLSKPVPISIK
jgi:lipoprotein-anchoring transpeptidase ErfK/SrfK